MAKTLFDSSTLALNDAQATLQSLTDTYNSIDESNAVALLKAQMLNWAENNFDDQSGRIQIRAQVPGLRTLKETEPYGNDNHVT